MVDTRKVMLKIKSELERQVCQKHQERPTIKISGPARNPTFEFSACCQAFGDKIKADFETKLHLEVGKEISESTAKIFKKFK